jgi:hypothetical protein
MEGKRRRPQFQPLPWEIRLPLDRYGRVSWILRRLLPEDPERVKQRTIRFFIFLSACVFMVISTSGAALGALELPAFVGTMLLLAGVGGLLLHRHITRPRRSWTPQELIFGSDYLMQRRAGLPDLMVSRDEVIRIEQRGNGSLVVHTGNRFRSIVVPADLHGYEVVRESLEQWHPIEPTAGRRIAQGGVVVLMLMAVAAELGRSILQQERLFYLSNLFFIGSMCWASLEFQKNLPADLRVRRRIFCFFAVFGVVFLASQLISWSARS